MEHASSLTFTGHRLTVYVSPRHTPNVTTSGGDTIFVESYGASLTIKAFLSVLVVTSLALIGKTRYLRLLNSEMMLIVVWTGGWLLTYMF